MLYYCKRDNRLIAYGKVMNYCLLVGCPLCKGFRSKKKLNRYLRGAYRASGSCLQSVGGNRLRRSGSTPDASQKNGKDYRGITNEKISYPTRDIKTKKRENRHEGSQHSLPNPPR